MFSFINWYIDFALTTYILNVHVCKIEFIIWQSLLCYTSVKQGINIKTVCPNYIHESRNTKSHLLQVYLGAWAKMINYDISKTTYNWLTSESYEILYIIVLMLLKYFKEFIHHSVLCITCTLQLRFILLLVLPLWTKK